MKIEVNGSQVFVGTGTGNHNRDAPAIVFVHGAAMDHTVWTAIARFFARHGFNVAAVDLPGHGHSGGTPFDSVEDMSGWLKHVIDSLDFQSASVVGHSMGSLVAMRFAHDHGDLTERISLLGTSLPMSVTPLLLNAAQANSYNAYLMANTWSHSPRGKLGSSDNPGVWMMGVGERLMGRCGADVFHADLQACNEFELEPADIGCPTLLVLGDADQMTPARAGLAVAEKIEGARTIRLEGCGHAMLTERPNQILDLLSEHHLAMK